MGQLSQTGWPTATVRTEKPLTNAGLLPPFQGCPEHVCCLPVGKEQQQRDPGCEPREPSFQSLKANIKNLGRQGTRCWPRRVCIWARSPVCCFTDVWVCVVCAHPTSKDRARRYRIMQASSQTADRNTRVRQQPHWARSMHSGFGRQIRDRQGRIRLT